MYQVKLSCDTLLSKNQGGEYTNITVKVKLLPTAKQDKLLRYTAQEYICLVNKVVTDCIAEGKTVKHTSATVTADLPSAIRNQAIRDGKSVYQKYRKTKIQSILKKTVCIWNNQNWKLKDGLLSFPVMVEGKSQRISIPVLMSDYQLQQLHGKLGALRISQKSGKWIAQIAVEKPEPLSVNTKAIGVDLGLKVPAVAVTEDGKTRFFGNGRQNKYMKRKFRSQRKKLGKQKKLSAIRKLHDKEQRWMKDQDHKISRKIVNFAIGKNVGIIRLEALSGIRQTARTSRKNKKNLHTWSFYRLAQYIEYKAALVGIQVEYVNPKHTSQICPACGELNKARDRKYKCGCGFKGHRDVVGALNIIAATVIDGKSLSA